MTTLNTYSITVAWHLSWYPLADDCPILDWPKMRSGLFHHNSREFVDDQPIHPEYGHHKVGYTIGLDMAFGGDQPRQGPIDAGGSMYVSVNAKDLFTLTANVSGKNNPHFELIVPARSHVPFMLNGHDEEGTGLTLHGVASTSDWALYKHLWGPGR